MNPAVWQVTLGVDVLLSIIFAARAIWVSMSGTEGSIFAIESLPTPDTGMEEKAR